MVAPVGRRDAPSANRLSNKKEMFALYYGMRKLLAIINIGIISLLITGCGADSAMRKGDKFYALGEYYDAAEQYKKAYSQTKAKEKPLRGQRALKMAD